MPLNPSQFQRLLNEQRRGNGFARLHCIRNKLLSPAQLREVDELILQLVASEEYERWFTLTYPDKSLMDEPPAPR